MVSIYILVWSGTMSLSLPLAVQCIRTYYVVPGQAIQGLSLYNVAGCVLGEAFPPSSFQSRRGPALIWARAASWRHPTKRRTDSAAIHSNYVQPAHTHSTQHTVERQHRECEDNKCCRWGKKANEIIVHFGTYQVTIVLQTGKMVQMKVGKCPTDTLSLTNKVIANPNDQANLLKGSQHVMIATGPGEKDSATKTIAHQIMRVSTHLLIQVRGLSSPWPLIRRFVFYWHTHTLSLKPWTHHHDRMYCLQVPPGYLGFSMPQRKWAILSLNQEIEVLPHRFDETKDYIGSMVLHIDFFNKKKVSQEPYDTDNMAKEFLMQFHNQGTH